MDLLEQRVDRLEKSVRRWRAGACVCGVALAAAVITGAQNAQPQKQLPAPVSPRYQITGLGDYLIVLDNQTNETTLLFQKRDEKKHRADWPWAADNSFSLIDALHAAGGAKIIPGAGR